jgi:DNA-binding NtrC family response regulator
MSDGPKVTIMERPELPPRSNLPPTNVIPRPPVEPMEFRLRLQHKFEETVDLVGDSATLGCGEGATIRISEAGGVSRLHWRLYLRHGRWSFEDVSTNGTFELDGVGNDTGQRVHGVNGWEPGRGYRLGETRVWLERIPAAEEAHRGFHGLIGDSPAMRNLKAQLERVGPCEAVVVLHGETGTGKEVAAKAIHALSKRSKRPMHTVNCAHLKGEVARTTLFGSVRGAFTGAENVIGAFEAADKSTLFLDEIAELPLPAQAELLRVLEDQTFRRVGGTNEVKVDVRLIVASHKDLGEEVCKGNFREDLFSRLDVVTIRMPTLAQRLEDLPMLVAHFARLAEPAGHVTWSKAAIQAVKARKPPHNLRGLRNLVTRTQAMRPSGVQVIEPQHITFSQPEPSFAAASVLDLAAEDLNLVSLLGKSLHDLKVEIIAKTLLRTGTQQAAADALKVSRDTIQRSGGARDPGSPDRGRG